MQENKGRWLGTRQAGALVFRATVAGKCQGSRGLRSLQGRAGPIDNHHGQEMGDLPPMSPKMELAKIIGAHDPDEMNFRIVAHQIPERFVCVGGADPCLYT